MHALRRTLRLLLVGLVSAAGLLVSTATPAHAATDSYATCVPDFCSLARSQGTITWYNRTAGVTGEVYDEGAGSTTVVFKAYANTTQIGSTETRTVQEGRRGFNFNIGDPDKRGGINRITVQVCSVGTCGPVITLYK